LRITEIFKSIQGETSLAGFPCSFVRTSGCNLRCSYCDTVYAYTGGEDIAVDEIVARLKRFGLSLAVVTGGEPLLQKNELDILLEKLLGERFNVLVETNGSLPIGELPAGVKKIMDIKCPGSGMSDKMLWGNLDSLNRDDEIKFVLSSGSDYNWAKEIVRGRLLGREQKILFSPVTGKVSLKEVAAWLLRDNLQVRLQPQLHKIIWTERQRGR